MSTPGPRTRPWRAAIAIVALYALVLSGFLAGLGGLGAVHAAPGDPAFAYCHAAPDEGGGDSSSGEAPLDCRALCRAHAGAGASLLAPPAGPGLPVRFPAHATTPTRTAPDAPPVRRITAPLGSRAPPTALSPS